MLLWRKSFVLVLALGLGGAVSESAPNPDELKRVGIEDAKAYAIKHNYEVLGLRRAVEGAEARRGRTRSKFFPTLGVAGGADTEITSTNTQGAPVGFLYTNLNLFNGFEDVYRSDIASIEVEKAEVRLKRAEFRVGLEVEQAFHLYLFKKSSIELKQEAIKTNEAHKKMAAQKRASGLASDSDIMDFDLKDALLKSDLLLLEQEVEEARTSLRRLLGEEIGSKIEPVGSLQHQHLKGQLREHVRRIRTESEAVVLATKDLAVASLESKAARSRWLPKVDLEVAAGYLPWDLRTVPGGTSMIGGKLVARFDVFSGFDTLYARQEQEANELKLENQLKDAILNAISDTENAFRRIATIQARVDLEEQNEQRARKYYTSVISEYRRGVKNSADLRVAADGIYEASLKREGFKYEFLNERITLERALGGALPTENISEEEEKPKKVR